MSPTMPARSRSARAARWRRCTRMGFTVHPESSYLRVEMTGLPSAAEVEAMFTELAKRAAGAPPRAMIELLVEQCLNFLDVVQVMSTLPGLGFPSDYRLALLITDD